MDTFRYKVGDIVRQSALDADMIITKRLQVPLSRDGSHGMISDDYYTCVEVRSCCSGKDEPRGAVFSQSEILWLVDEEGIAHCYNYKNYEQKEK